jgi:O-antigen chain-terminating methyltransferase
MTTPIAPLADRVQGIPLLGRPLALVLRMLHSGKAQARLITAETRVRELDAEARAMRARLDALESMAGALHREIGSVRDDVTATLDDRNRSLRGEVGHAVAGLRGEWRATLARDSRALERAAAALAAGRPADGLGVAALSAPGHYVAFENAFRGRWKVEERMRWYVPHLRALYHHGETRPVLDVGCGRGEFLLALKEAGLPGVGIDLNPAMVDTARAQGLDVTLADAVAHLRDREPGSLAAIASFHVIEHIPFEGVLHLIEAAKRALMPGGLLILETPNPENLAVGGCTFWYDPTHIRPLPPATMQFYVRTAGFEPVRIARFFLDTEGPDTATIDVPVQPGIDGPLDYGLLATKPRDPA